MIERVLCDRFVNRKFTALSPKTLLTETSKRVDIVFTLCSILTWIVGALVNLNLTLDSGETWRAYTLVATFLIQTSTIVLAGIGVALVDVDLAARSVEAARALAPEGARRVDTNAAMFARRTDSAFVVVNGAIGTAKTRRASADRPSVDRQRVAGCIWMARVEEAAIIKLAEDTGLAGRTLAIEATRAIVASGA